MNAPWCPECGQRPAALSSGICWQCHVERPDDLDTDYGSHPLPPFPTGTLPGTSERIECYVERLACGHALFHPLDALITDAVTVVTPTSIARLRVAPPPNAHRVWLPEVEEAA
jgi:hypothetical protein